MISGGNGFAPRGRESEALAASGEPGPGTSGALAWHQWRPPYFNAAGPLRPWRPLDSLLGGAR
eukprot:3901620-Pyramimonas_sp.AAC.2